MTSNRAEQRGSAQTKNTFSFSSCAVIQTVLRRPSRTAWDAAQSLTCFPNRFMLCILSSLIFAGDPSSTHPADDRQKRGDRLSHSGGLLLRCKTLKNIHSRWLCTI